MLNFAAPALLAFIALAGMVLLLHSFRKLRREVPSLMLWRSLAIPSGTPRARRHLPPLSLPLFLQLGAVLLAALALAQPYFSRETPPDHLIVVLDGSIGMGLADDSGESRFDQARAALRSDLASRDAVGPERVSLVLAGPQPRVEAARRIWRPDALDGALDRTAPMDAAADWGAVGRVLAPLYRADEDTRIEFMSFRPTPDALLRAAPGEVASRVIGEAVPHLDVVATITPPAQDSGRWRLEGEATFREGLTEATLVVGYSEAGGAPLPWAEVALTANEAGRARIGVNLDLPGQGVITLSHEGRRLAQYVLDTASASRRILYLGAGDQPLLRALQSQPGVELFQADRLPETVDGFDLVVVDDVTVAQAPQTNVLWIGTGRVEGMDAPTLIGNPDPDFWAPDHPLGRAVDWLGLSIAQAYVVPELADGSTVLAAGDVALLQAATGANGREIHLAFDPADSNWVGTPGLALFAGALVDWLGPQTPSIACLVGQPCRFDARHAGTTLDPLQEGVNAPMLGPDGFVPQVAGLYRLPGQERLIAVNAVPETEAETMPTDAPLLRAGHVLPVGIGVILLTLATVLVILDTAIAARRKGRMPRPPVMAMLAIGLLMLGLFNVPGLLPAPRETVIIVGMAGEDVPPVADTVSWRERIMGPRVGLLAGGAQPDIRADAGGLNPASAGGDMSVGLIEYGADSIALAAAMIPEESAGRIVLAADLATRAGSPAFAPVLAALEAREMPMQIDAAPASEVPAGEVLVRGLHMPQHVVAGDPVTVTALVHAGQDMAATLTLRRDGEVFAEQDITLAAGANRVETLLPDSAVGDVLIEAEIAAASDVEARNNRAAHLLRVNPLRPIAVVAPTRAHGDAFAGLLQDEGLETRVLIPTPSHALDPGRVMRAVDPDAPPQYMRGWLEYGGIVTLNTPAIGFTQRQLDLMEQAVSEFGLGMLMLGGPNSFGPGGYYATQFDALSPLSSRVPRDAPEVGMVFVLDRSGSMQQQVGDINRLDVAKNAVVSAAGLLNPESQIGVVVFDTEATTVLPLQKVDLEVTEQRLGQVDPGGGTSIYPGLIQAWDMLRDADSAARHVVVMTDGLSQPGDFPGILGRMVADGITVSAVAIGQGSDAKTVDLIASLGGGTAHVTSDFAALPSILSQEAMQLASLIEEGVGSVPVWHDTDALFLRGLPDPMPPVDGFVLTTPKPEANLVLTTADSEGEDMPLMAWWRYGNGHVLSFASDATGPWTARWQNLPGYGALWADALRTFQPATPTRGLDLRTDSDGETLGMTVSALGPDGEPQPGLSLAVDVTTPQGTSITTSLHEGRPGIYHANFPLTEPGRYELALPPGNDDEDGATMGYVHSYPVRFDSARGSDAGAWLAARTGGDVRGIDAALADAGGISWHWRDIWQYWTIAALALFMLELTRRYASLRLIKSRTPARGETT